MGCNVTGLRSIVGRVLVVRRIMGLLAPPRSSEPPSTGR